jgi:Calcineurin-like phosphoesterase superfamily domain
MTTALISDLHIGTRLGADVARRPEVRERLAAALRDADHVVFLGDLVELRELPVGSVLKLARTVLSDLAAALAGKRVTLVGGNHDHRLIEPCVEQLRTEGVELGPDWSGDARKSPIAAELDAALPDSEVVLAYPGLWIRDDVYALHGHYLDLHMVVPRVEAVLGRMMARRMLGREVRFAGATDYERAIGPLYALSYNLAQGGGEDGGGRAAGRLSNLSRDVWARAHARNGGSAVGAFLIGRVAIPAGVAALNLAGLGPFSADLSGEGLRRAGLAGVAQAVANLGVEAEHVIFGHTHRHGPLAGEEDQPEWRTATGTRLWNTGSWFLESALMGERRMESAYWPGGVVYVHDTGPPEPVNVLRDVDLQPLQ